MTMFTDTAGYAHTTTSDRFKTLFAGFAKMLKNRRAISQMSELDERMLRDIGLTRFDVMTAKAALQADPIAVLMQARTLTISRS